MEGFLAFSLFLTVNALIIMAYGFFLYLGIALAMKMAGVLGRAWKRFKEWLTVREGVKDVRNDPLFRERFGEEG